MRNEKLHTHVKGPQYGPEYVPSCSDTVVSVVFADRVYNGYYGRSNDRQYQQGFDLSDHLFRNKDIRIRWEEVEAWTFGWSCELSETMSCPGVRVLPAEIKLSNVNL